MMRLSHVPGLRGEVILAFLSPAIGPDVFGYRLMKILIYSGITSLASGSSNFLENIFRIASAFCSAHLLRPFEYLQVGFQSFSDFQASGAVSCKDYDSFP